MKAAKDQFLANLLRARALGALAQSLNRMTTSAVDVSDFLRMELALAVSSLDHFVHELVRAGMIEVHLGRRPTTDANLNFRVPLDAVKQGLNDPSQTEWLDQAIRDAHGWLAFQQPDKIAEAVRLISDARLWVDIAARSAEDAGIVKRQLKVIVDRRNKIVHEADMDPLNPGERWPIDASTTAGAVDFIESIGLAIYAVVS